LDIEVTTICGGVRGLDGREAPCRFCYKSNTPNGKNMSFETFKTILDKFPKVEGHWILNQIAFGADAHATSNPDLWKMMEYCRSVGVIPNITVADITDETADKLAQYCGAVSVSRYANKDLCYDSVKRLTDRGMTQVNIHIMVSAETEEMVWETLRDRLTDPRLEKLNAIVLLSLKQKGRGKTFTRLPFENFKAIVDFALENKIGVGFDSCGCNKFLASVKDHADFKRFLTVSEPCESFGLFSSYIDVDGNYFPCSFAAGEQGWQGGMSVLECKDFMDIWRSNKLGFFRALSLTTVDENKCRKCLLFEI
jgi:MoaA/NifB/PqqE/SkfB family radical SAM enzyme